MQDRSKSSATAPVLLLGNEYSLSRYKIRSDLRIFPVRSTSVVLGPSADSDIFRRAVRRGYGNTIWNDKCNSREVATTEKNFVPTCWGCERRQSTGKGKQDASKHRKSDEKAGKKESNKGLLIMQSNEEE